MPNTLAHYGIQALTTRALLGATDLKWVFLGCVIPDLPWILRRIISTLLPEVNVYDLRLYVMVQASLIFCLLIAAAFAACTVQPWKVFSILSLNSLLHLLLDAMQTKWANGVHFFAPVSWELLNFGWFWPESLPTYVLTALGLLVLLWKWRETITKPPNLSFSFGQRSLLAIILLFGYMLLPLIALEGPEAANAHFIKTLKDRENRAGRLIEFDRNDYKKHPQGDTLTVWTHEEFQVAGHPGRQSATVSIRGRFISPEHLEIYDLHEHNTWFRDGASYLGLIALTLMWGWSIFRGKAYQQFFPRKGSPHRP